MTVKSDKQAPGLQLLCGRIFESDNLWRNKDGLLASQQSVVTQYLGSILDARSG